LEPGNSPCTPLRTCGHVGRKIHAHGVAAAVHAHEAAEYLAGAGGHLEHAHAVANPGEVQHCELAFATEEKVAERREPRHNTLDCNTLNSSRNESSPRGERAGFATQSCERSHEIPSPLYSFMLSGLLAAGQTNGTITGTVTAFTDSAIPGVKVVIVQTRAENAVKPSPTSGQCAFPFRPPGQYSIQFSFPDSSQQIQLALRLSC
jgi:hypothetical protein